MINFQRLIYSLKTHYGTILDLYRESGSSLDIETGRVTLTRTQYRIKKAVVLPSSIKSETSILRQANILFKQSGQLETDKRSIIIDKNDLISNNAYIIPDDKDYIVYKHERYGIEEINIIDNNSRVFGYHLIITKAKKELAYEQYYSRINDTIYIADSVTGRILHAYQNTLDTILITDLYNPRIHHFGHTILDTMELIESYNSF